MSGSGTRWAICKSAPRTRQTTMPEPHRSVFLHAGCPSCRPTNSVKALKALVLRMQRKYVAVLQMLNKNAVISQLLDTAKIKRSTSLGRRTTRPPNRISEHTKILLSKFQLCNISQNVYGMFSCRRYSVDDTA